MKTLLGKKVKGFEVYKMSVNPYKKDKTFGMIWLDDSDLRIKIKGGKFYFINKLGQISGIVLKSNPAYKKIKRAVAIRFKTYRKQFKIYNYVKIK